MFYIEVKPFCLKVTWIYFRFIISFSTINFICLLLKDISNVFLIQINYYILYIQTKKHIIYILNIIIFIILNGIIKHQTALLRGVYELSTY